MGKNRKQNSKAFTLIELLVVIAIIALLLAILMPSLSKVKKIAQDVICRTNIKTLQLATIIYTDAYGGKMPVKEYTEGRLWVDAITAFMDEVDEARYCPSTKSKNIDYTGGSAKERWSWIWGSMPEPKEGSYAFNDSFFTLPKGSVYSDKYWQNTNNVPSAQMAPVFMDSRWIDISPKPTNVCPGEGYSGEGNSGPLDLNGIETGFNYGGVGGFGRALTNRHGSHSNFGFLDGHQETIDLDLFWTLSWDKTFTPKGKQLRTDGTPIYPGPHGRH